MDENKLIDKAVQSAIYRSKNRLDFDQIRFLKKKGLIEDDLATPTSKSIRSYINRKVLGKVSPTLSDQLFVRDCLKQAKDDADLFGSCVRCVAKLRGCAGFVVTHDQSYFLSGLANLLKEELFADLTIVRSLLKFVDDPDNLLRLIEREFSLEPLSVTFGSESGTQELGGFVVICRYFFVSGNEGLKSGYVGVISSKLVDYELVVSYLDYMGRTIEGRLPLVESDGGNITSLVESKEERKSLLSALGSKMRLW
ncbi:hypothetical protein HY419_00800 [candidate division WWE3 bacterium]|nr:hypothetical protein [candidate division WWE3 bacterium]